MHSNREGPIWHVSLHGSRTVVRLDMAAFPPFRRDGVGEVSTHVPGERIGPAECLVERLLRGGLWLLRRPHHASP